MLFDIVFSLMVMTVVPVTVLPFSEAASEAKRRCESGPIFRHADAAE